MLTGIGHAKAELVFMIVQGEGLLYEVAKTTQRGQPARLYGVALSLLNDKMDLDAVNESMEPAEAFSRELLEYVFNDGPRPAWLAA